MPPKKKSLSSAFQNLKESEKPVSKPTATTVASPKTASVSQARSSTRKSVVAKTRGGKKGITFFIDPEAHRQLKLLSVEQDISIEAMMRDALNDFFQKNKKSRIA